MAVARTEGRAEGRAEGEAIGAAKERNLLAEIMRKKGYTEEQIQELFI